MANPIVYGGAKPHGIPLRLTPYVAGGAFYTGDFVTMDATGRVVVAAAGGIMLGVAASYASAAGVENVQIWDHPDQIFEVQASAADIDAQTDIGLNYDILATAGDATYKVSKHEMDSTTGAVTATLPLKLMGLAKIVGEAFGARVKCTVRINQHKYGNIVAGL